MVRRECTISAGSALLLHTTLDSARRGPILSQRCSVPPLLLPAPRRSVVVSVVAAGLAAAAVADLTAAVGDSLLISPHPPPVSAVDLDSAVPTFVLCTKKVAELQ